MKQTIKINESQLRDMIKESLQEVLKGSQIADKAGKPKERRWFRGNYDNDDSEEIYFDGRGNKISKEEFGRQKSDAKAKANHEKFQCNK